MFEVFKYLLIGTVFGLAAGISPGPLLVLIINETIKYNKWAGFKVACAPLITDLPIILLTIFLFSKLENLNIFLGIIAIAGGLFLAYLGYENIQKNKIDLATELSKNESIKRGVIANFLSPHPYLFWLTVGTPIMLKAYQENIFLAVTFVVGFYLILIGSKITIALLVEKSRDLFHNNFYLLITRLLGVALFVIAILFIKDGLNFLGFLK